MLRPEEISFNDGAYRVNFNLNEFMRLWLRPLVPRRVLRMPRYDR
jgi:hypothetical protein